MELHHESNQSVYLWNYISNHTRTKLRLAAGSSHAQARAAYKKFMQAERISWTKRWQSGRCETRWGGGGGYVDIHCHLIFGSDS